MSRLFRDGEAAREARHQLAPWNGSRMTFRRIRAPWIARAIRIAARVRSTQHPVQLGPRCWVSNWRVAIPWHRDLEDLRWRYVIFLRADSALFALRQRARFRLQAGSVLELDTRRLHMVTSRPRSRLMWTYEESDRRLRLRHAAIRLERFFADGFRER